MKVLLTGATGFVGSHVLDVLAQQQIATAVLLRASSNRRFITAHVNDLEVREGSVSHPAGLRVALNGITHVIHCAGCVKSLSRAGFHEVNATGTRNVVEAANAAGVERVIHISSLAAGGPATPDRPAQESDRPQPVSEYGRSKLAGEEAVRQRCQSGFVIIRPPAVYGPRDGEFLRLFKAVKSRLLPDVGCGRQALSLVYVEDLASVIVGSLTHPTAAGQTYYPANPEIVTARQFGESIARQMGVRCWRLPVPVPLVWPACLVQELVSRVTRKPDVLSLQKYAELRAPGWVCDATKLEAELGLKCPTRLEEGVRRTLAWYREAGWL
jgi:nucleoside-diphosphate-sugar epimerase